MNICEKLLEGTEKLSVIGLGYVGMPIAVSFSSKIKVIGFDLNDAKIRLYKQGIDPTKEVGNDKIKACSVDFTSNSSKLREARFHIVAVPTPINPDLSPNLKPVISASEILGKNLTRGSIVVYESTVYPGVTEEVCRPILEKESGLKCGQDFKIGYSPERINPGDSEHCLENIIKVVSGMDKETLDLIADVYSLVVKAGIYKAESIKIAEAAKVIENSQRDINIAFMNELSIIFNKLGIDTQAVLKAANTKWNFLNFSPGLVGGHCIGVDPYYLIYKAEEIGYHSQIILAGRRINDSMGKYVAENTIKKIVASGKSVDNARVAILGFTFKENCPDSRNSRVFDIIRELIEYGIQPLVSDPYADTGEVEQLYGIKLCSLSAIKDMDAVIIAVAHNDYKSLSFMDIDRLFREGKKILVDVKGILDNRIFKERNYIYWRL